VRKCIRRRSQPEHGDGRVESLEVCGVSLRGLAGQAEPVGGEDLGLVDDAEAGEPEGVEAGGPAGDPGGGGDFRVGQPPARGLEGEVDADLVE
jgi:hypothetical protein